MKKLIIILILFSTLTLASENHIEKLQAKITKLSSNAKPAPNNIENMNGILYAPATLPVSAILNDIEDRYHWFFLPDYSYDYDADTLSYKQISLTYSPTNDLFSLFPAVYGLLAKEPFASLNAFKDDVESRLKNIGGSNYREVEVTSENYYGIPGFLHISETKIGYTTYIWYVHILWKNNIGYQTHFLCSKSAYTNSMKNVYFRGVLSLIYFSGQAGLTSGQPVQPTAFKLFQNYPNPFNATTTIPYTVNHSGYVSLEIFDAQGKLTETLINHEHQPGTYHATWKSKNNSSGIYFFQIKGSQIQNKKMLLIK